MTEMRFKCTSGLLSPISGSFVRGFVFLEGYHGLLSLVILSRAEAVLIHGIFFSCHRDDVPVSVDNVGIWESRQYS